MSGERANGSPHVAAVIGERLYEPALSSRQWHAKHGSQGGSRRSSDAAASWPSAPASGWPGELSEAWDAPMYWSKNPARIQPEDPNVPRVMIPNSVRAEGVATGIFFHEYMSNVSVPLTLAQAGEGLRTNPTPGNDTPASAGGSINNVGALPPLSANNFVGSFLVQSPSPSKISDIVVNYTLKGAHSLDEGFVMRYAEKQGDGSVVIRNYGEGNAAAQSGFAGPFPLMMEEAVWRQNVKEIVDNAK
jgi:hypothetical protein